MYKHFIYSFRFERELETLEGGKIKLINTLEIEFSKLRA